jgi:hypothetical protein
MAVNMPGFLSAGSQTNVGGSSSSNSQQSSSFSSEQTFSEIQAGSDPFGMKSLPQVLGNAGRKKRELPQPEIDASSSSVHKK